MSELRVTAHGKQLLLDGRHLADCVDHEAAEVVAICLNHSTFAQRADVSWAERRKVEEFFA